MREVCCHGLRQHNQLRIGSHHKLRIELRKWPHLLGHYIFQTQLPQYVANERGFACGITTRAGFKVNRYVDCLGRYARLGLAHLMLNTLPHLFRLGLRIRQL